MAYEPVNADVMTLEEIEKHNEQFTRPRNRRPQRFYRKTNEKYDDNYVTWNVLRTLAQLIPYPVKTPHSIKSLAKAVGMSYHGMLRLLHRFEKKSIVEKDMDQDGRRSWMITSEGTKWFTVELFRRIRIFEKPYELDYNKMPELVERAYNIFKGIRELGWKDHQARDLMVTKRLDRIEKALRKTDVRRKMATVTNPGAFFRTVVNRNRGYDGRQVEYLRKFRPCLPGENRLEDYDIVAVVKDDPRPFRAIKRVMQSILKKEPFRRHPEDELSVQVFENEYDRLYRIGEVGSHAYAAKMKPKTGAVAV